MNHTMHKSLMVFLVPFAAVIVMGILVWDIVKTHDLNIENERSRFVSAILANELADANIIAREFTLWDEAIKKIVLEKDRDWTDQNTGSYLIDSYHLDTTFILTPDNLEILRFDVEAEERPSVSIPLHKNPSVLELADKVRALSPANFDAVSDWMIIGDDLYLITASAFTYESGFENMAQTRKPEEMYVLILVKRAGAQYWESMAKRLGLPALSANDPMAGGLQVPLLNTKGETVTYVNVAGHTDVVQTIFANYGDCVVLVTALLIAMALYSIKKSRDYKIERDKVLKLNREMDNLVKQRTQDLEVALVEAQKASRAKSSFLSAMSHEFRTPLNGILGFSQLLSLKSKDKLSEKENGWIDQIGRAGQLMLTLVNDVLDLARAESGKIDLKMEPLQPRVVFKDCYNIVLPMAEEANITMKGVPKTDKSIFVDRLRLQQVILNIMNNSVKYNRENGSITFGCFEHGNGKVRLYIEDTGIGISKEDKKRVFEPFFRADCVAQLKEGTGVGLSLVVQLTEAMGGEISFESELGKGTTFYLDFPQYVEDTSLKT